MATVTNMGAPSLDGTSAVMKAYQSRELERSRDVLSSKLDNIIYFSSTFLHQNASATGLAEGYAFWYDNVEVEIKHYVRIAGVAVKTDRSHGQKPERFGVAMLESLHKGRHALFDNLGRSDILCFLHNARKFRNAWRASGRFALRTLLPQNILTLQVRKVHFAIREFIELGLENDLIALFERIREKERQLEVREAAVTKRERNYAGKEKEILNTALLNRSNLDHEPARKITGTAMPSPKVSTSQQRQEARSESPRKEPAELYGFSRRTFAQAVRDLQVGSDNVTAKESSNKRSIQVASNGISQSPTPTKQAVKEHPVKGQTVDEAGERSLLNTRSKSPQFAHVDEKRTALVHLIEWLLADKANPDAKQSAASQELETLRHLYETSQSLLESCVAARVKEAGFIKALLLDKGDCNGANHQTLRSLLGAKDFPARLPKEIPQLIEFDRLEDISVDLLTSGCPEVVLWSCSFKLRGCVCEFGVRSGT